MDSSAITAGGVLEAAANNLDSGVVYDPSSNSVTLAVRNAGILPATVRVENVYAGTTTTHSLAGEGAFDTVVSLNKYAGWYDFILTVASDVTFQQEIAGHLETGKPQPPSICVWRRSGASHMRQQIRAC